MILITGANGKTGRAILAELVQKGQRVRCLVHQSEQAAELLEIGAADVIAGDMRRAEIVSSAVEGVDTIYHIPPNMSPDEVEIGRLLLSIAGSYKVTSFIYHSVFHPHISKMRHHWKKLLVEDKIFASGLSYSIVQPTAYMQNLIGYWPQIVKDGIYAPPYSPQTRLSLVDLLDVAEASVKIILGPAYRGGIFELVGTPSYSQAEVAAIIGDKIGKNVKAEGYSRQDWEANVRRNQMSEYSIQTLLGMFEYYENYGMWGSPFVLEKILGRRATPLDQFIDRVISEN